MPTTRLKHVRAYLDPDVFAWMEQDRAQMRRTSRSAYLNLCATERMQRAQQALERRPTQGHHRRSIMTA